MPGLRLDRLGAEQAGVDLARALGGVDHQAVLRVGRLEQLVDGRADDALGCGSGAGHGEAFRKFEGRCGRQTSIKASSSRATSWTDVLIRVTSNSFSAASSIRAA